MIESMETFKTARLIAERVRGDDFEELCWMHCDPVTMATLGGVRSHEETREFLYGKIAHWNEYGHGLWIFRDRQQRHFIGRGLLEHIEVGGNWEIEVGYSVVAEYWGNGYATEMAKAMVAVGFKYLDVDSIVSFALPDNYASRRVMEKVGFRFERTVDHVWQAQVLYRIRREEHGSRSEVCDVDGPSVIE